MRDSFGLFLLKCLCGDRRYYAVFNLPDAVSWQKIVVNLLLDFRLTMFIKNRAFVAHQQAYIGGAAALNLAD